MEFKQFKELVKTIPLGKQLPDAVYLHEKALDALPKELKDTLVDAIKQNKLNYISWNIVKFFKRDHKITLLDYPTFFEEAYPSLNKSYTIDLQKQSYRVTNFSNSDNPPILHRKETFLPADHPEVARFSEMTKEGENIGLYENTKNIGFKQNWERLINRKGYLLDKEGRLQPKCDSTAVVATAPHGEVNVERHLTAIDRNKLSSPMQLFARHDYFNGEYSVFDYGCGKGDDVRELEAHGIDVEAWDPVHRADGKKIVSDIVNLGFVINVIEDRQERNDVIIDAYKHTKKVLAISAMVAGESIIAQFKPYKDGVITSRNTFQKYYSQSELRSYIETTLGEDAIAVTPGTFFIFKDKDEEQLFLSERQKVKRSWKQLTERERTTPAPRITKDLVEKNQELFDDFWNTCLDLGRLPANSEFDFSDRIRTVCGSHNKAFEASVGYFSEETFKQAKEARRGDLLVYFSLGLFSRRKAYAHMPESLKRDLKAFFGSYKEAIEEATQLLFSVGRTDVIGNACYSAYEKLGSGELQDNHSLTVHSSTLLELPPILRIYIGCATQLYGDTDDVDLIKIHMRSGKVSLMKYDDFDNKPLPLLEERIKIKLRDQDIDFFDYVGEFQPQPLYNKSDFLEKNDSLYNKQHKFEIELQTFSELDFSGYGPKHGELLSLLNQKGLAIKGYDIVNNQETLKEN